jgi:phage portal protein BeeE
VAVLGDGLKYEAMTMSAVDAQLIDQLKWTAENVCVAFHVSPSKIFVTSQPTYNNVEAIDQNYYSETLQNPIECIELLLDEGLGLTEGTQRYGVEFDLDGLMRMDTSTRVKAAQEAINAGMTVNEARFKFFDLGPVTGGDAVYLQQQNYSLEALAKRDASANPFAMTRPAPPSPPPDAPDADDDAKFTAALLTKAGVIAQRNTRAA